MSIHDNEVVWFYKIKEYKIIYFSLPQSIFIILIQFNDRWMNDTQFLKGILSLSQKKLINSNELKSTKNEFSNKEVKKFKQCSDSKFIGIWLQSIE